jgi:hypothetical protein
MASAPAEHWTGHLPDTALANLPLNDRESEVSFS